MSTPSGNGLRPPHRGATTSARRCPPVSAPTATLVRASAGQVRALDVEVHVGDGALERDRRIAARRRSSPAARPPRRPRARSRPSGAAPRAARGCARPTAIATATPAALSVAPLKTSPLVGDAEVVVVGADHHVLVGQLAARDHRDQVGALGEGVPVGRVVRAAVDARVPIARSSPIRYACAMREPSVRLFAALEGVAREPGRGLAQTDRGRARAGVDLRRAQCGRGPGGSERARERRESQDPGPCTKNEHALP